MCWGSNVTNLAHRELRPKSLYDMHSQPATVRMRRTFPLPRSTSMTRRRAVHMYAYLHESRDMTALQQGQWKYSKPRSCCGPHAGVCRTRSLIIGQENVPGNNIVRTRALAVLGREEDLFDCEGTERKRTLARKGLSVYCSSRRC